MTRVVKIIPKICECGQRMGYRQKEYEDELIRKQKNLKVTLDEESHRLIELETFNEFYGMKLCCRNNFWNSDMPFIKDANKNSFVDEIGISSQNLKSTRIRISKPGFIFKPIIDPPDFPDNILINEDTEEIPKHKEDILDSIGRR